MTTCPRPDKQAYASEDAARAGIAKLCTDGVEVYAVDRLEPYECVCGGWHYGHRKKELAKQIHAALRGGGKGRRGRRNRRRR